MTAVNKVLFNNAQSLSLVEKARARSNIDASKVVVGNGASRGSSDAVTGTTYTVTDQIEVSQKSLVLCNVSASIIGVQSASDLSILVEAPLAIKLGTFDGDSALGNATANYTKSGTQTLHTQTGFYAILDANTPLEIKYTFQSTVSDFTAVHLINYCVLGVS